MVGPGALNNIDNPLEKLVDFTEELWNEGKFINTMDGEHIFLTREKEQESIYASLRERNPLNTRSFFNLSSTSRILETSSTLLGSAPIFNSNTSINTTGSGRQVPSDWEIDFAKFSGTTVQYYFFFLLALGALLIFAKLLFRVEVDIHFAKLIVVTEFLARTSLINVNLGHLLYQFFDRVFNLDMWLMWDVTNEESYRGSLGGKLDEYSISMLTVNSSFLALSVYLVSLF